MSDSTDLALFQTSTPTLAFPTRRIFRPLFAGRHCSGSSGRPRSSSGSADGSQEAVAIDDSGDGNAATVKGSAKVRRRPTSPETAGTAGRHPKVDAEAVKSDKADAAEM